MINPRRRQLVRMGLISALLAGSIGVLTPLLSQAAIGPGDPPGTFAYLRSDNDGDSFTPGQLSPGSLSDFGEDVNITHVDAFAGTVHALFDNNTDNPPPRKVLYRRSTDSGKRFSLSVRLDVVNAAGDPNNGDSSESDLAAVGTDVHVVWEDDPLDAGGNPDPCCNSPNRDEVFYTRSTDDGQTFAVAANMTNSDQVHNRDPDVAADGNLVGVAYEGRDMVSALPAFTNGDDVLFRGSADGGVTFGAEINLTNAAGAQDEPGIEVAGSTVHIVFRNRATTHLAYVRSTDAGATFSAPVDLPGPEVDTTPTVLAQGSLVHVLGCHEDDPVDTTDGHDLLYYRSTDGGTSFAPPVVISRGSEECNKPAIDAVEGDLNIIFERDVFGEADVFYLRSHDGGLSFGSPRNLSDDFESSSDPSVAVDPEDRKNVFLSWNDKTDFLLALQKHQRLPLDEGGERKVEDEDVIRFSGAAYEMVLDGRDVGLKKLAIDALAIIPPTPLVTPPSFVLSFTDAGDVPGVGTVDDSDLVLFTPTSLGEHTAGTFSLYFDGSDVGLTSSDEDLDAAEIDGGNLYLSTIGDFSLSDRLTGADEDVFSCNGFTPGPSSACGSTGVPFDGSAVGLEASGEDVDAFSFNASGNVPDDGVAFFSFEGSFSVPTASGGRSDIARCAFPEDPPATLVDCGGSAAPLLNVFRGSSHAIAQNLASIELLF